MAYVVPDSTIEYFGDVIGWDPSSDNRPFYGSVSDKDFAFNALRKLATESQCAYIEKDGSAFRSELPMSTLIYARYMRFKNTAFENRWFYAFITSVDYANNGLTLVRFQLDTWVTWDGYFRIANAYIVRQHVPVAYDIPGRRLIDEGLSYGDYIIPEMEEITPFVPYFVLGASVEATPDGSGGYTIADAVPAQAYKGNMLAGTNYFAFNVTSAADVQSLSALLTAIVKASKQDSIISMRIVPEYCIPKTGTGPALPADYGGTFTSAFTFENFYFRAANGEDSYRPKNKKLYTFPYQMYSVINGEGSENEYRVEFFANRVPSFLYEGVSFDNCEVILAPRGYRQLSVQDYEEAMIMRQFPQGSMGIDQYKAYVAQMTSGGGWIATAGKVIGGIAQVGAGALGVALGGSLENAVQNVPNLAQGAVDTVLGLLQDHIYYDSLPNAVKGTSNNNIMAAIGQKKFFGLHKTITAEYARALDEYFDLYGYKINQISTMPDIHRRPHWTFCQMEDVRITGGIPSAAAAEIAGMLRQGVRCWRVLSEVGNYQLNNYTT